MPLFSANCHFIEPANIFEGRMSKKWADRAPVFIDNDEGGQSWIFEGEQRPLVLPCAAAGIPQEEWTIGTIRMDQIRPGCYDAKARLKDMDLDGVDVAAVFSSPASMGFNGDLFFKAKDPDLGNEAMRAWNDWNFEEWVGVNPERFVPVGCTSYFSPEDAAAEVLRNAARGFKAVVFRNPVDLGGRWVGTGYWDPFFRACEETQTVIIHHTEALPWWPMRISPEFTPNPYGMSTTMFQSAAMDFVNSMIWGGIPVRFPKLKIHIAESGGSWIPHLLKHMTWATEFSVLTKAGWPDPACTPLDLLKRTFVFSTLELELAVELGEKYGMEGWMIEDDYPHCESVWPNTKKHFGEVLGSLDSDSFERFAWRNASELFRHPVPAGGFIESPELTSA